VNPRLRIYLIRHGETQWSVSGQHTGRTELPLTLRGQQMARDLAPVLGKIAFSLILTSPRLRARETCALAGVRGAVDVEDDLTEWDYGRYEGLRTTQIRDLHPDWDVWRDGCPGGETPADVAGRADRIIARLHSLTGNVALFSHGQFGRVLAARWIGLVAAHGRYFAMDPASIGILGFEADHPRQHVIGLWNASA